MNPALSVVIPTYNRSALLKRVLDAYDAQSADDPFEVLVADDGSSDGTPELLRAYQPRRFRLRPLVLGRNAGPGQARNAALAEAAAPIVLIAGDDILPGRAFVARHLEAHRRHPETVWAVLGRTSWPDDLAVNSLMRHIDGVGAQQFSYAHISDGQELDFRHFYTSNVSLKKALLDSVQPWFDPDFVHAAYEDAELAYRLSREAGLRIRYDASAHATHYHPYTTASFAERQYRCGLMAAVFRRKHPELGRLWRLERLTRLALSARLWPVGPFVSRLAPAEAEAVERAAVDLGTACESIEGPVVDRIYSVLLEYFVLKGLLEGERGSKAEHPRRALLLFGLLYHLGQALEAVTPPALAASPALAEVVSLGRRYEAVRRSWPRAWRWLLLQPVRQMIVPRY